MNSQVEIAKRILELAPKRTSYKSESSELTYEVLVMNSAPDLARFYLAAERVVDAARGMIKGGHYDTCGFVLTGDSECSCGATKLHYELAAYDALKRGGWGE